MHMMNHIQHHHAGGPNKANSPNCFLYLHLAGSLLLLLSLFFFFFFVYFILPFD